MIAHSAQGSSSGSTAPSALWSARHEQQQRRRQQQQDPAHSSATTTTTAGGSSSSSSRPGEASPPQDVASMKAEIAELQSDTTATLDRAIAAAQATVGVGNHVSTELLEQRERMGDIDAEARDIDDNLKRTGYNLKHGFTWRGALTSPFRKASKKPAGAAAPGTRRRDIAPVFKDDYQQQQQDSNNKTKNKKSGAAAPAHGGVTIDSKGKKERTGLFGSSSNKKGAGAGGAGVEAGGGRSGGEGPKLPEHVPEGFDKQLDDLDGLLDGLSAQANAIGAELRQQNDGIEALGERVEPLRVETASQAQQIKRRFRVRG